VSPAGLPRTERLKGRDAVKQVLTRGRSAADALIVLRYLERGARAGRRVGVGTARGFGGAVARNRMRRRLRSLYRVNRDLLPVTGDFFFIARAAARRAAFPELTASFQRLADAIRQ
jgi:ribonuclease P protein component